MDNGLRSSPCSISSKTHHCSPVKLYKRRWLVLLVFCLSNMANATLFISFGSITDIICKYYRISADTVDWTANSFLLSYAILALPSAYFMSNWGMRMLLIIGSSLNAMCAAFHYAGSSRDKFVFVMTGQVVAAFAIGTILQIPARLSAVWFGEHERATATSIGVALNIFGLALGFLQPTHMVHSSTNPDRVKSSLEWFYLSQLVAVCVILLMTYLFFEEAPPTPPAVLSSHSDKSSPGFSESLHLLWNDRNFNIMAQSFGVYVGMFCSFSVLLNQMVTKVYPAGHESSIGWMGFGSDCAAIFSITCLGLFLDRYPYFRGVAIFLNISSMCVVAAFLVFLIYTSYFAPVFVCYVVLGSVGIPYFSNGLEHAAVLTFPVPEGTSSAVVLLLGNLYGFIFTLVLGKVVDGGYLKSAGVAMVALYLISSILAICVKSRNKRIDAEIRRENDDGDVNPSV